MDMRAFNEQVVRRFRAGLPIEGLQRDRLVLLTTTGRRTGAPRTAPMMAVPDGDDLLVVASNDGAAAHPGWFENLLRQPQVVVETPDGARSQAVARVLGGQERGERWQRLVAGFPFFEDHQRRAGDREIPLVRLHRQQRLPPA